MNISEVKNISIVDYCVKNGIDLIQNSKEYFRLSEYDSCVINSKKNLFKWNSKSRGGDVINFVQLYHDCSFKEAIALLKNNNYDISNINSENKKENFIYEKLNEKTNDFVITKSYLVDKRKIDNNLVNRFISNGLIKEDNKKNILFLWKDKNENIKGCTESGTKEFFNGKKDTTWKKIQKNSDPSVGFNYSAKDPKNLYFFESEIDLMSYITLNPSSLENGKFISMSGLKKNTVLANISEYLTTYEKIPQNIYLCVDNDKAGREFLETFENQFVGNDNTEKCFFTNRIPNKIGFDWNDMLTKKEEVIKSIEKKDLSNLFQFTENFKMEIRNPQLELD